MKKIILLISACFFIFIFSCHRQDQSANKLLNADKISTQIVSIDINRDTIISTEKGAMIFIPKGAFSSTEQTVKIEIKEAYTIEDIVAAGLTTTSDGHALSSGGMIYINAVSKESVTIKKSIDVLTPTDYVEPNMKLYKGEVDASGKINWTKPDTLTETEKSFELKKSEALFNNSCASCHAFGKLVTGPDLAHILKRTKDVRTLFDFTINNAKVMADYQNPESRYYRCMYNRYNKTPMNTFPNLTFPELHYLYDYIENESDRRHLPLPKDEIRPCLDSCEKYEKISTKLRDVKERLSKEQVEMVVKEMSNLAPSNATNTTSANSVDSARRTSNKVNPENYQSKFYQFKIQSFGWYNIDIILKETDGVAESRLMIRIIGEYKTDLNVFLIIPSAKVFTDGGVLENKKDEYGFYTDDGKIFLPQKIKAYIIAMGESEDHIIFAKKEFTTSTNQQFDLSLSVVTKEQFNMSLASFAEANLNIKANDTKNADSLRSVIKELKDIEKLKPTGCDCNCGMPSDTSRQWPAVVIEK